MIDLYRRAIYMQIIVCCYLKSLHTTRQLQLEIMTIAVEGSLALLLAEFFAFLLQCWLSRLQPLFLTYYISIFKCFLTWWFVYLLLLLLRSLIKPSVDVILFHCQLLYIMFVEMFCLTYCRECGCRD